MDRHASSEPAPTDGYAGFFDCFNAGRYFEAHDVLEAVWLPQRHEPDGNFYKGLIQLAGAFVHLQKSRPGPAAALFRIARANLARYPKHHRELDVSEVIRLIDAWASRLERSAIALPLVHGPESPALMPKSLLPVDR